jgi:hypothetical protein
MCHHARESISRPEAGFPLDFAVTGKHRSPMKTLLCALISVLCLTGMDASTIRITGTLTWKVKKPDCTFKLDGAIQNLSSSGTTSGSLKMVLWATPAAFPSKGYAVAEHNMGQLAGGYQFDNFKEVVPEFIPKITGNYYFSIAILEYTTSGWLNRAYITTGRNRLDNGEFVTGSKWVPPTGEIIDPPAKLPNGQKLTLTVKSDGDLNQIKSGTRAKTNVLFKTKTKAIVTISGDEWDYLRTYNVGKSNLYNQKVPVGKLYLDPEESTGSSTVTLFFQTPTSGIYKNIEENPEGGGTTWGLFTVK